jgi:hypothetical protein
MFGRGYENCSDLTALDSQWKCALHYSCIRISRICV